MAAIPAAANKRMIRRFFMIDQELLAILACPVCKGDISLDEENQKLICADCGRKYPIRDGIPVMLEEEAEM
jgi:uncharacterized protein YbaR (Trm112 family)